MTSITFDSFGEWLDAYGRASKENDSRASAELFAPNAKYYETPFAEPMVGKDAIYCIFLVEFDGCQKCSVFREWWHSQMVEAG